jgi:hypothetical protein
MKDVSDGNERASRAAKDQVKHLSLRLPSAPDFSDDADESLALTRTRAMLELMHGQRLTIHALICQIVDTVPGQNLRLPYPKRPAIPTGTSHERLDLRMTQQQLNIIDGLRDAFGGPVLDPRSYYSRPDVIRELLWAESQSVRARFLSWEPSFTNRK